MPVATALIVEIYNRVSQLTKTGTSGYIDEDEFNGIIKARQLTLLQALMEVEDENKKAADLIAWLKVKDDIDTDSDGKIALPDDFIHLDSLSLVVDGKIYPCTLLHTDEIDTVRTSPVRAPDLSQNDVDYYWDAGQLTTMPEQEMTVRLRYFKVPPVATITLTPSPDDGDDYLTPAVDIELGWPYSASPLLTYLVLMDYGVEMKEQAVFEFAQYGLSFETVKIQPEQQWNRYSQTPYVPNN